MGGVSSGEHIEHIRELRCADNHHRDGSHRLRCLQPKHDGGKSKALNNKATDADHIPVVFTLKIRGGCDTYVKRNGTIGTAGKGALIQKDLASTLGVTQDQYLFEPMRDEADSLRI